MAEVRRIFPEDRTALIAWMEENFHSIRGYVACFDLTDGTTMMIYSADTHLQAMGLASTAMCNVHQIGVDGEFVSKSQGVD